MRQRARGSATIAVLILLLGIVFVAANAAILLLLMRGTIEPPPPDFYQGRLPYLAYFIAAPLLLVLLTSLLARRRVPTAADETRAAPEAPSKPAAPTPPSPAPAFRLLALLQQEGRLIDFLEEDLDAYGDAQVGAAVRSIHAGCRKALSERIQLERIYAAEDGSDVVVEKGFDPAAVRLTGNVAGEPPFRGTLQHGGWRVATASLPQSPSGVDPTIISPAEVEIP